MLVNYDSKYNQFTSNYDSRVVIYERKMYIRLATDQFAPLDKSTLGIDRILGKTFNTLSVPFLICLSATNRVIRKKSPDVYRKLPKNDHV